MAGESTPRKTSPTLAQIAARDHSEMLRNALNVNPAKMVREALEASHAAKGIGEMLAANPVAEMMREARVFDPAKSMREALEASHAAKGIGEMLAANPVAEMMREARAFDPAKAMQRVLPADPYESIHNAVSNFEAYEQPVDRTAGFLEDLSLDVPELFEYIDEQINTAEIDADGFLAELEASEHPAVLTIWEYVARSDSWARRKFQKHSEPTIRVIKTLAVVCIYGFLLTLAPLLSVAYGTPGFFMSVVLLGGAKIIDDSTKANLKPEVREGLGATCPTCGAFPDMWCVTVKGNNPGTQSQNLHKPRLKRQ